VLIAPVGDGAGCPATPAIEIEFCGPGSRARPGFDPDRVGGGRGQSVINAISAAQLAYLLDGIDWRNSVGTWRPEAAG
jgi:hypothetical protein